MVARLGRALRWLAGLPTEERWRCPVCLTVILFLFLLLLGPEFLAGKPCATADLPIDQDRGPKGKRAGELGGLGMVAFSPSPFGTTSRPDARMKEGLFRWRLNFMTTETAHLEAETGVLSGHAEWRSEKRLQ